MSVAGRDDHAALLRRASSEVRYRTQAIPYGTQGALTPLDEWETLSPYNIRTDAQLVAYAQALVGHFGPQHALIDIPWYGSFLAFHR